MFRLRTALHTAWQRVTMGKRTIREFLCTEKYTVMENVPFHDTSIVRVSVVYREIKHIERWERFWINSAITTRWNVYAIVLYSDGEQYIHDFKYDDIPEKTMLSKLKERFIRQRS